MLTLPPNWQNWCAGATAVRLLRGINHVDHRIDCSALLILASLRLWMATTSFKERTSVKPIDTHCWGVGRLRYRFLPEIDDPTFLAFLRRRRYLDRDTYIVPVQADLVFRFAAKAELGKRVPQIFSVDSFLTWRAMWAQLDAQMSRQEISAQFFGLYNECVQEKNRPELLIGNVQYSQIRSSHESDLPTGQKAADGAIRNAGADLLGHDVRQDGPA